MLSSRLRGAAAGVGHGVLRQSALRRGDPVQRRQGRPHRQGQARWAPRCPPASEPLPPCCLGPTLWDPCAALPGLLCAAPRPVAPTSPPNRVGHNSWHDSPSPLAFRAPADHPRLRACLRREPHLSQGSTLPGSRASRSSTRSSRSTQASRRTSRFSPTSLRRRQGCCSSSRS